MAEESYLFSENYLYRDGVTAVGSNPADETNSFDYDLTTSWASVNPAPAPPGCFINYVFPATFDIDYIWLKSSNLASYTIWEWTGAIWQVIGGAKTPDANGISLETFTPALGNPDRIRLEFTATVPGIVYIHEVFFFKLLHTLQVSDDSLASNIVVTPVDRIGGNYILADGSQTSYRGIKIYHDITYEFEYTPKANRDSLYNIYASIDYGIRPNMVIYPDPDEYPEDIFRVVFDNIDFPFSYTIPYKGSGFSGTLRFKEY